MKSNYSIKSILKLYLLFTCFISYCNVAFAATALVNGSPLSGLASTSTPLYYTLAVPSGATNLAFTMSGGTGDADLYVKFGATPTTSSYDCRPYATGNNETCPVNSAQAGTYYVMLRPYSAFTGVSLKGAFTSGSGGNNTPPTAVIGNGPFTAVTGQSISMNSAGSNDPDGSIASYQWNFGDGASSNTANPAHSYATAGTFTVTLTVTDNNGAAKSASTTATITSSGGGSGGSGNTQLNETNLSAASGNSRYYTLNVPAGATNLVIATSGGTGDADLYVRFGSQPTTSSYDCRPYKTGNNESCPISNVQAGTYHVMIKAYSAYSGLSLSGTYNGGSGNSNVAPNAVIANGPFSSTTNTGITMSSNGSSDPDGSISSYLWNFGDGSTSTAANPTHSYAAAGTYSIQLTVTDNQGATDSASTNASITNASSGFTATSHYYDKGSFDYHYSDYEAAFSDNYSDSDVEIHSYIVIDFNANVSASTINANNITVKRLNMPNNAENNQNIVTGSFTLIGPRKAIFKPDVIYYVNEGGTFDWNNPNWNGLKPNYQYSVTLSSAIKNTSGANLTIDEQSAWTFETIDNDYGLYWFKDGAHAMKYVPGRAVPLEYYHPSKPTHIYGHGWEKTSVHMQEGKLRDYRREPMTVKPGSMYPSQAAVDLVQVWKDPSKNHEHKAWNFGIVYWNQFADDDYANLSKPQMAEAKIWSTDGRHDMSYAIRKWTGSSWVQDHVQTHAPMKPVSVILADAFIAATQEASNPELRLSGNSLGNQIVTGISYILKKEYAEGRIGPNQFPKRLALLDPYWRDGSLKDSWTTNHPAYVDLGVSTDSAGKMSYKVVTDIIQFADNDPNVSFVLEYYDTSRTTDGSTFGQSYGDKNIAERDVAAISYLQASWINGSESDTNYLAHRHVFGRYWYPWQYAYAPPATGFSASSPDSVIRANMNYYKSTKIRYSISAGGNTPSPADDNYVLKSGSSWQQ